MKILHSKGDGDGRGLRGVSLLMLSSCSSKQLAQVRCGTYWSLVDAVEERWRRKCPPVTSSHHRDPHDEPALSAFAFPNCPTSDLLL